MNRAVHTMPLAPKDREPLGVTEVVQAAGSEVEAPRGEVRIERSVPDITEQLSGLIADGYSVAGSDQHEVRLIEDPARILYLAPWLTIGGSDKGTIDWLRQITSQMFRRYLFVTVPSDNALFGEGASLADEAWCLPELMDRQAMPQFIMDSIATRGVDIVHMMNSRLGFDMIPTIKAAFPQVRIVVQLHAEEQDRSGHTRYVASRYDNLIDAYSVVSEDMRHRLTGYHVSPSKVKVIYLGVDARGEYDPERHDRVPVRLPEGRFNVLFPARLTLQKDPELALEVIAALRRQVPETALHVVGDGDMRAQLEASVEAMGLGDTVSFHGASKDMWSWYKAADAVLMTSQFEGVPLVVYEAMSMGIPVVSNDVGATGEILTNEVGCLVREDAEIAEYVEALVGLARDPERRANLGIAARRRVLNNYTVEEMGLQHRQLYANLLATAVVGERGR